MNALVNLPVIAAGNFAPSSGGVLNGVDAPGTAQRGDGPESTCPEQPSPDLLAEDLEALVALFNLTPYAGATEIRVFAVHHKLPQIIALGWLKLAAGRWNTGQYVPAGALAERMELGPVKREA